MNGLEIVLIILVGVWTLIFIVIAVAVFLIARAIKRALDKANNILDKTEEEAEKVNIPSKLVIASILGFMAKNSWGGIRNLLRDGFFKKKK